MARKPPLLHGILIIDKPAGWTSHDVVARLRRIADERRAGHAGTLDPAATGVLPVVFGDATRLVSHLSDASKTYLADITFGVSTDTADADGTVTGIKSGVELQQGDLMTAVASFSGHQFQVPPMHSAIKIGGRKLYELARSGEVVDRPPRPVVINQIELINWDPPIATLCIDCSKGTYVRSLAVDLGERLGQLAHLSNLVRLRTGPFELSDAWTMAELEAIPLRELWERIAIHPDAALASTGIILDDAAKVNWNVGRVIYDSAQEFASIARAYSAEGAFLGVAEWNEQAPGWQPIKVMNSAA